MQLPYYMYIIHPTKLFYQRVHEDNLLNPNNLLSSYINCLLLLIVQIFRITELVKVAFTSFHFR